MDGFFFMSLEETLLLYGLSLALCLFMHGYQVSISSCPGKYWQSPLQIDVYLSYPEV